MPLINTHILTINGGSSGIKFSLFQIEDSLKELFPGEIESIGTNNTNRINCYQTKKWIGAFAAVLGGVNAIVFSGGIGEHIAEIRERICNGLEFLGSELDATKNKNHDTIISSDLSKITVYVIKTNEELMISKYVCSMLNTTLKN